MHDGAGRCRRTANRRRSTRSGSKGPTPEPLRREFPTATVSTTRTETVLFRRVEKPAELDELIDQLLSRGVVLTEVHEVRPPLASTRKGGLLDDDHV